MELPLHLMEGGQLNELKEHVLLNLDWLLAKLQAASFRYFPYQYGDGIGYDITINQWFSGVFLWTPV